MWSARRRPATSRPGRARPVGGGGVQARAASDGMRTAGGSRAVWDAMAAAATARGEVAWVSQDTRRARPCCRSSTGARLGDVARGHPGRAAARAALHLVGPDEAGAGRGEELHGQRDARADRDRQQVVRWRRDVHAARALERHRHRTCPGRAHERGARGASLCALLNMAMHDAAVGCWDAKYAYFNPRPTQLDPGIKTAIGLPNFPSYTSGHSTFSAAAAVVLSHLFPARASEFDAMKEESSLSRSLRLHPLPVGHRGGQGPRQADRRLHRPLRARGRSELTCCRQA